MTQCNPFVLSNRATMRRFLLRLSDPSVAAAHGTCDSLPPAPLDGSREVAAAEPAASPASGIVGLCPPAVLNAIADPEAAIAYDCAGPLTSQVLSAPLAPRASGARASQLAPPSSAPPGENADPAALRGLLSVKADLAALRGILCVNLGAVEAALPSGSDLRRALRQAVLPTTTTPPIPDGALRTPRGNR